MTPELSVVVPAFDAEATVGEQLDALLAQESAPSFEIVVVDNGSRDGTRDVVARVAAHDDRIRLVDAPEPSGAAHARNAGVRAARAATVVFCDADDIVAPGWLRAMGDALKTHDFVTGPLEVDRLNPRWLVESRGRAMEGAAGSFRGVFPFASSCNMGVRRALLEQVGGFDQRFAPGEDVEVSYRLFRAGAALEYVPEALVHYRYRPSAEDVWRQARSYARVQPALVAAVRRGGYEVPGGRELRGWLWLARHVLSLRSRDRRPRWFFVAGGRVGTLEGRIALLGDRLHRARRRVRPRRG